MQVALRNGGVAFVDDELFEKPLSIEVWEGEIFTFRICDFSWRHKDHERLPYVQTVASRAGRQCCIRLHRLVMQASKGQIVDHIDRNVLRNTLDNLRFVDHQDNNRNRVFRGTRNGIYQNPLTGELLRRTFDGGKERLIPVACTNASLGLLPEAVQ